MKKKNTFFSVNTKNLFIAALVVLGSFMMLHRLTEQTRHVSNLSYSEFLDQVEQNKVKKVHIAGQEVSGELKDNKRFETTIANNPNDIERLRTHNVAVTFENVAGQNSMWYFFMLFTLGLFGAFTLYYFMRQTRSNSGSGGSGIFNMGKSKAKMFMPSQIKDNFNSVAGAAEAKEELKDIVDFLKNPDKYKKLGAKMTRGVLLIGAPGNGKTLLARAVAGEANCPFFTISGSDFIEVFVGVGAARVRDLFAQARQYAPAIIFIDEIDAVGRQRGSGLGGGHDEREQTLNQLLTEMDGFQTHESSVIVMAATNRADVLDNALLRPGRFDRRVHVPYPDLVSREQILKVHAKGVKISQDVNLHKIARSTPGFSGADLANIINEAAILASKNNQTEVEIKDFEEAHDKVTIGKKITSIRLTDEDKKVTAYHESGHALVRLMMPEDTDPLHKVTIIPRGSALGVTHFMPEREKYQYTKDEMLANIAAALGGRAAEELIFNKLTTGAYSDFIGASSIARDMVCKYGMTDLGSIVYSQSYGSYQYSEKTAERIDEQVRKIVQECYDKALNIIKTNRDKLEKLALELIEKETLYAGEIYELLGIEPRVEHRFS